MKYLIHLQCERCGWRWSVYTESLVKALNYIVDDGCPKECGHMGTILVTGHEELGQSNVMQIIGQGYGTACIF